MKCINTTQRSIARLESVDSLLAPGGLVSQWLDPVPNKRQLARWLESESVPRFKANPDAHRGGGTPYYHVAAVEQLLRSRSGHSGK